MQKRSVIWLFALLILLIQGCETCRRPCSDLDSDGNVIWEKLKAADDWCREHLW